MNGGYAALLLVISVSLGLLGLIVESGDLSFQLRSDIQHLGERTDRELAARSCLELALLRLSEDPDYEVADGDIRIDIIDGLEKGGVPFGHPSCIIKNVNRISSGSASTSPYEDRQIETVGYLKDIGEILETRVSLSDQEIAVKSSSF